MIKFRFLMIVLQESRHARGITWLGCWEPTCLHPGWTCQHHLCEQEGPRRQHVTLSQLLTF